MLFLWLLEALFAVVVVGCSSIHPYDDLLSLTRWKQCSTTTGWVHRDPSLRRHELECSCLPNPTRRARRRRRTLIIDAQLEPFSKQKDTRNKRRRCQLCLYRSYLVEWRLDGVSQCYRSNMLRWCGGCGGVFTNFGRHRFQWPIHPDLGIAHLATNESICHGPSFGMECQSLNFTRYLGLEALFESPQSISAKFHPPRFVLSPKFSFGH